jgi:AcrR family transcriptional regulator
VNQTQLTRERIVDTALRISDGEPDLGRLTVRRLASELGVGTMTLYSYFRSKEEILDAMADRVLGGLELEPARDGEGPDDAIRAVARGFLLMMREHPVVVRLLASRVTDSQQALRGGMEAVLVRLLDSGLSGPLAIRCYSFLVTYTLGFVSYGVRRPWAEPGVVDAAELRRRRSHFYAGLPIEEFPVMVGLANELVGLPDEEQYTAAIEAFIRGTVVPAKFD